MSQTCLCCNEPKVDYIKRQLCHPCYVSLRRSGLLSEYPLMASRLTLNKIPPEVIESYKLLMTDSTITLEDMGKRHGYTRERARQVFEKIFGYRYTVVYKKRQITRKEKIASLRLQKRDPRYKVENWNVNPLGIMAIGIAAEKKVLEICELYGYEVKAYHDRSIDLLINGLKVDVKSSQNTTLANKSSRTPHFHFAFSKIQFGADFLVCYAEPINKFFIIPQIVFPRGRSIFIPEKPIMTWTSANGAHQVRRNHWYQYLEAWHLLKPTKPIEVIFSRSLSVPTEEIAVPPPSMLSAEDRGLVAQRS